MTVGKRRKPVAPKEVVEEVIPSSATFRNTSKVNIFTTKGRVGPNCTVELDVTEAENYKGLSLD